MAIGTSSSCLLERNVSYSIYSITTDVGTPTVLSLRRCHQIPLCVRADNSSLRTGSNITNILQSFQSRTNTQTRSAGWLVQRPTPPRRFDSLSHTSGFLCTGASKIVVFLSFFRPYFAMLVQYPVFCTARCMCAALNKRHVLSPYE
jgi:hypothetical protein